MVTTVSLGVLFDFRPSTFAQAVKLRRLAAAKEKEIANREATFSFSEFV